MLSRDRKGTGMSDLISAAESKSDSLLGEEMLKKLFLKKEPFYGEPSTPFVIEAWQAHHHLLQHLILYNNVLMVMTGRDCTGKTTFSNGFQTCLSGQFVAHKITATENLTGKSLQRYLVQLFSLNSVGIDMNDIVGGYLSQLKARKQHCVLIIDDAHLLSDEILQLLFYYISRQSDVAYLHFLLVGDTELIAYIEDQLGEKHDSVHFFELPRMTLTESTNYLSDRLCAAGYTGPMPFDKPTLQSIYQEAEGDFRQLLILATHSLIALNKANRIRKKPFWRRYLTTGAVSSFVIILALIVTPAVMRDRVKTQTLVLPEKRILSTDVVVNVPKPEVKFESVLTKQSEQKSIAPVVTKIAAFETPIGGILAKPKAKAAKPAKKRRKSPPAKQTVTKNKRASLQPTTSTKQRAANVLKKQLSSKLAVDKTVKQRRLSAQKAIDNPIPEPSIEKQFEAIQADREERRSQHHVVLDSVVVLPNPLEGLVAEVESEEAISEISTPITKTPSTKPHYVIQLLAASNLKSVREYAKIHSLPADAKLYKTHVKEKDWYTLVIGHYLSNQTAKKALKHLPKSLAKLSPWVRSTQGLGPLSD